MVYVGSSAAHWKTLQLSLLLHSKQSPNLKTNEHLLACFTKAQLDVLMSEQHPVVHWDIASVMSPRETLLTQPWLITHHLVSLQHYTTHHSFWSRAHLTASMSAPLISLLPLDGWMDTSRHYTESGWWTWWAGVLPIGYQTTKTFPSSFLMPSWWYEPHQCLATPSGPVGICPCSELVLANGLKAAYYDHISWVHLLMNRWQSSGWNKQFKASSGS